MCNVKFVIPLFVLVLISIPVNALTLTLVYEDKPQPPYYIGESNQVLEGKPGVAVEMLQQLSQRIDGLTIDLKRMPWKRALYSLKANRIDGVFNASYKKERLAFGRYPTTDLTSEGPVDTSRRIATISYSLYQLRDFPIEWQGYWHDLTDKVVGAPLGYSIVGDLRKKGIKVEESNSTQSNLAMLINKRLKVVALQTVTADSILAEKQYDKRYAAIEKLVPTLISKAYYLMLSNDFVNQYPVLAQRIWDEIRLIREEEGPGLFKRYQD